jgi:hypothetical protein
MLFECDAEGIEKGMAWFVGPGAARPLKNLIAIDWFALSSGNRVSVVVLALEPETFSVLMKSPLVGSFVSGWLMCWATHCGIHASSIQRISVRDEVWACRDIAPCSR